jgi:hypothetical protein
MPKTKKEINNLHQALELSFWICVFATVFFIAPVLGVLSACGNPNYSFAAGAKLCWQFSQQCYPIQQCNTTTITYNAITLFQPEIPEIIKNGTCFDIYTTDRLIYNDDCHISVWKEPSNIEYEDSIHKLLIAFIIIPIILSLIVILDLCKWSCKCDTCEINQNGYLSEIKIEDSFCKCLCDCLCISCDITQNEKPIVVAEQVIV